MSVILEDRPIETVREETIDTLIYNYSHGIISEHAFERRLDVATESNSHAEIVEQVKDLSPPSDEALKYQKDKQLGINYAAASTEDDAEMKVVSILGGNERSGRWVVPAKMNAVAVLGGVDLDFSDAVFTSQRVTLKVFSLLGGINTYVPENVNVVSSAFCILGGIDNKAPSIADKQAPTIVIEGYVLLGGLDIKIKTTIKEKFIAFARQMREVFDPKM
ncbi:LiaF domain-containing protein [Agaribacter flavus]|uniref:LiaF domain-containing protein n=1 Tax=Agaribacter flavus TaxID=1902781 RepID=A0ABV7FS94_9ALTE